MYEAEVNRCIEPIDTLPSGAIRRFAELSGEIEGRTLLPWGEHCTECNWPTCYTNCELYSPREDGACRLFVKGMVRIDYRDGLNPYLLKIHFKNWGKLWTVGNLKLYTKRQAARTEKANMVAGALARSLPLPRPIKTRVLCKFGYLRRCSAEHAQPSENSPNYFLLECYNPNRRVIALTFTVRLRQEESVRPYQKLFQLPFGFMRKKVPVSEIAQNIDLRKSFEVEIVPNESNDIILYFGLLDFVKMRSNTKSDITAKLTGTQWKCIVWDLDNTLWDGTLIEDGPDKIQIRQAVIDIIKETDQRGILHSIASKNNYDEAMKILRLHEIDELFLYPQINWQPKSQSIIKIAKLLNIGVDTLVFVDDQQFEREEVKATLSHVTVLDSADFSSIPDRAKCQVPITEDSKQRRLMYRQQEQRNDTMKLYQGDYMRFLRDCNIRIDIGPLDDDNLERVYELAQRTNQMNFSGNRYPHSQLKELIRSEFYQTWVIKCSDKFGSYGIVGFAVVDIREPRLMDLMFSCRIQSKRVEHVFISFLLMRFAHAQGRDFYVNYRKTPRNTAAGKVFDEMGFKPVEENDGVLSLVFAKDRVIPQDRIITITETNRKQNEVKQPS